MLISETVPIKITKRIIKRYRELGYKNISIGNITNIKVRDLSKGSNVKVIIQCDYCGKEIHRTYADYIRRKEKTPIDKDCCFECLRLKNNDVSTFRYGVDNVLKLDNIKDKIKQTNLDKYGVEYSTQNDSIKQKKYSTNMIKYGFRNATQNEQVKEKTKTTNMKKYGVEYFTQSEQMKQKSRRTVIKRYGVSHVMLSESIKNQIKDTCLKKYGVENPSQSEEIKVKKQQTCFKNYGVNHYSLTDDYKEKYKQTSFEHFGVDHPMKNEEVMAKAMFTLSKNYKTPTSSQQLQVFNLINALGYEPILNYPERVFNLDVAIFIGNKKIDIEYDGWYWHQNQQKDIKRNKVLITYGWNVIRILSGNLLPSKEELINAINLVINEDKKLQLIKLDDWKLNN